MAAFGKKRESKFRHTFGKEVARELWYGDVRGGTTVGDSNGIAGSKDFIAFPAKQAGGGAVIVLPVADVGKKSGELPRGCSHAAAISDLAFSPFDDASLATASEDGTVQTWNVATSLANATATLTGHSRRVDAVVWNPVASGILATASQDTTLKVWDVERGVEASSFSPSEEVPQSLTWSWDGSLLLTTAKDLKVRLVDPRAGAVVATTDGHAGLKGSRCAWLGSTGKIVTTGYSAFRVREFKIFDVSNFTSSINTTNLDSSTGIIMPFYDPDVSLLYLAGKGDAVIRHYEITSSAEPVECSRTTLTNQTVGMAALPKRAMNLMDTEVSRLLQVTTNDVVPISFEVPRKTKSEYHADIYPNTRGLTAGATSAQWLEGVNGEVPLIDLTPAVTTTYAHMATMEETTNKTGVTATGEAIKFTSNRWSGTSKWGPAPSAASSSEGGEGSSGGASGSSPLAAGSRSSGGGWQSSGRKPEDVYKKPEEKEPEMRKIVVPKVVRTSKFRHIAGKGTKKEGCWDAVRANAGATIETTIAANRLYTAVMWEGVTGQIAIFPTDSPVRLPVRQPTIECTSMINDMGFSPHNQSLIAAACDDTKVRIYAIPDGGLTGAYTTVATELSGHARRLTTLHWHPTVSDVMATTSGDQTLRLWNVESGQEIGRMGDFNDAPFYANFNWTGEAVVTSCKDKMVRVFDARTSTLAMSAEAHQGTKAWKALYLGDTGRIATVGFTKGSKREIILFDSRNLSERIGSLEYEVSSGAVLPFYDAGTGLLFIGTRGDGNLRAWEINDSAPFIHEVAPYASQTPVMGLAKLPTYTCDVANCEFAKFLKLSGTSIEPVSFTVPRQKKEYFQDDIFPPTPVPSPTCSVNDWLSGTDAPPELMSLCPEGMVPLSQAGVEGPKVREFVEVQGVVDKRTEKEKLLGSMNNKMDAFTDGGLPQDAVQGSEAWDDNN